MIVSDDENDTSTQIIQQISSPTIKFVPFDDESRHLATIKFNLVIKPQSSDLKYSGNGNACKSPPIITICSHGEDTCLFNMISILMTGRDTYSAIIRHVVCNYISNPVKYGLIKMYIPLRYKNGRDYIISSEMHNFKTWGVEVEIIAMAQLCRFNMWLYTNNNQWCHYGSDKTVNSEKAFYLSNLLGSHFDPVVNA